MGKPVILVADRTCPNKLPFDVSPFKVLFYENTIAGREAILRNFVAYLSELLPFYEPVVNYGREVGGPERIG
jgi:hypothetical protein